MRCASLFAATALPKSDRDVSTRDRTSQERFKFNAAETSKTGQFRGRPEAIRGRPTWDESGSELAAHTLARFTTHSSMLVTLWGNARMTRVHVDNLCLHLNTNPGESRITSTKNSVCTREREGERERQRERERERERENVSRCV